MTAECEHKSFVIGWPEYHGGAEWCCVDCGRPRKAVRPELEPAEVIRSLEDIIAALRAERDAYKRAKAENDERFMIERDEERTRAERAERALKNTQAELKAYQEAWESRRPDHRYVDDGLTRHCGAMIRCDQYRTAHPAQPEALGGQP